jgi:NitT/TauT family transport system substrate-binding protein
MPMKQTRRRFLSTLSLVGAAGLVGPQRAFAAEGSLETTTVRLMRISAICHAPQFVAEELLHAEGFTDVRFVDAPSSAEINEAIARGKIDFNLHFASQFVSAIDGGAPITILAGAHVGCFELVANKSVRALTDLKGKRVGVEGLGSSPHLFVSVMAAHVGLDPAKDIRWVESGLEVTTPSELFADGKIDAFLGTPPQPQELRARNIGHVIFNSSVDPPWSQYFCCVLAGNRDFVRQHPVATKRVLRAILKAADFCAAEPARAAQQLVDGGFTPRYDYAFEALRTISYDKWREYDAEDTIRFYALRMHEAGMIKATPQKIIADGTDWRFLDELKRELKA